MKEQGEGEVLEIEHKYLLTSPPSELFVPYERFMIIQTYLQNDVGCSERVRDNRCLQTGKVVYTHTSKRPGPNGGKWESEREVDEHTYVSLLARKKVQASPIFKVRYVFEHDGLVFELDHFLGPIDFYLLEVEVDSLDTPVNIPEYLGPYIEVTEEKYFTSAYISKKPYRSLKRIEELKV